MKKLVQTLKNTVTRIRHHRKSTAEITHSSRKTRPSRKAAHANARATEIYRRIIILTGAEYGRVSEDTIARYIRTHWDDLLDLYGCNSHPGDAAAMMPVLEAMAQHGALKMVCEGTWVPDIGANPSWLATVWIAELRRIGAKLDANTAITTAEMAAVIRMWETDQAATLDFADRQLMERLLLATAPAAALSPWMYFQRAHIEDSPDRYITYRTAIEKSIRSGILIPPPVIRAVMLELHQCPTEDRQTREPLAELLWIAGIRPEALSATECGSDRMIPACRGKYQAALTDYDIPSRDDFVISFGQLTKQSVSVSIASINASSDAFNFGAFVEDRCDAPGK